MLHFYREEDFEKVVFHKLNTDQILQFLDCPTFKSVDKRIEALKVIQRQR